jgi:hypothetical protein
MMNTAAANEARARIAAHAHRLDPNAAEIRDSKNPEIHNVSHKYHAPAQILITI